jgi:hypothetical protein
MNAVPTLALVALLALGADQQGLLPFRSQPFDSRSETPAALESSSPDTTVPDTTVQPGAHSSAPLRPESRLLLVRYVDGEFAKLVQSLPGGKKGFKLFVGKPLNMQRLNDTLRLYGTAAVRGETIQITGLEIRSQEIIVQINGGTKKHFNWRQHIQFGVGDVATPPQDMTPLVQITGANLVLDYGRPVPDMSPDDLKHDLAAMLDFSKEHSATVNWIDTLPQQFQDAIKDHRAVVGMDSEMVLAAMGRPEHKIREKSPEGNETEDWIYGSPPARTTFVTFAGDTVIRVKEFN